MVNKIWYQALLSRTTDTQERKTSSPTLKTLGKVHGENLCSLSQVKKFSVVQVSPSQLGSTEAGHKSHPILPGCQGADEYSQL